MRRGAVPAPLRHCARSAFLRVRPVYCRNLPRMRLWRAGWLRRAVLGRLVRRSARVQRSLRLLWQLHRRVLQLWGLRRRYASRDGRPVRGRWHGGSARRMPQLRTRRRRLAILWIAAILASVRFAHATVPIAVRFRRPGLSVAVRGPSPGSLGAVRFWRVGLSVAISSANAAPRFPRSFGAQRVRGLCSAIDLHDRPRGQAGHLRADPAPGAAAPDRNAARITHRTKPIGRLSAKPAGCGPRALCVDVPHRRG
jgi:hypothetical protein